MVEQREAKFETEGLGDARRRRRDWVRIDGFRAARPGE
jgi:hypothetical protein